MIMVCQHRSRNCYKCTALVGGVDNEENYATVGAEGIREIPGTFNFVVNLKAH